MAQDADMIPPLDPALFAAPTELSGRLRFESAEGGPILPGSEAVLRGEGLAPGQEISVMRGSAPLNPAPLIADSSGALSFRFRLPAEAVSGVYVLAVLAGNPPAARLLDLKISPNPPLCGVDDLRILSQDLAVSPYQAAYSPNNRALFVSAAGFGRPGSGAGPSSLLFKLDPETLEILAQAAVPLAPLPPETAAMMRQTGPAPVAVFGLGIDEAQGRVWATNTLHDTVAVYDQADLALVKQFEPGLLRHPREILLDGARGRAYASGSASDEIGVFDARSLEPLTTIRIQPARREGGFIPMGLALDSAGGRLFAVSRLQAEIAEIDLETHRLKRLIPVPGARNAAGLAYDAPRGRLLVAAQGSDDVSALDADSGALLFRRPVGAGALSLTVDPATGVVWAANRDSGTITALGAEGQILANLGTGSYPNHMLADGSGAIFAFVKARGPSDPQNDRVLRIAPA